MIVRKLHTLTLASIGVAVLSGVPATAQDEQGAARFAAPRRIKAGDEFLGEGRLYPSPAVHDVDGDGHADVLIGDLIGRVTYACRAEGKTDLMLGAEKPLKDRSGEQLRFHNW